MTKSTDIRTLKALDRPTRFTIPDTKGLHLWVRDDLKKYWVFRFTVNGNRHDTGLGSFPEITLADAKHKVAKLRGLLANGINPAELKQQQREAIKQKAKVTFSEYARDHIDRMSPNWWNHKNEKQWINTLTTYAYPVIGKLELDAITTEHVLKILEPIWTIKNQTSSRLRGRIERIMGAAISQGLRQQPNPAIWKGHLEHLLPAHRKSEKHHEALPYAEIPELMAHLANTRAVSILALQFTILTAARTGEVRFAEWNEIKDDVWVIPAHRMKAKREHQVPLCSRALELLKEAHHLAKDSNFIFNNYGKPLSSMAMLMAIRRYRTGLTVHGFRSSFRDWVSEETTHSSEVAEMALAHTITNKVEAAYRRGILLERRRALMLDWEKFCLSNSQSQHPQDTHLAVINQNGTEPALASPLHRETQSELS
ncbi:MAG: tyrosine-type recombinase/integrase [Limnohabitans sp.]